MSTALLASVHNITRLICPFYRPPTKLWKVNIFSHVCLSVNHSVHKGRIPCDHYLWCIGPRLPRHRTSMYRDPQDMQPHYTVTSPAPNSPDLGLHCTGTPCYWYLAAKTGDLFKLVHLRTPPPTRAVLTSGGYSYWNAFLFYIISLFGFFLSVPENAVTSQ